MTYLLDTNACIRVLNGTSSQLVSRLHAHDPAEIRLCSVVKAELFHGARKSSRPSENLRLLRRFFAPLESLHFDDGCAEEYGVIRTELERQGTPIGANDLMIAAIALHHECTLVTNNIREFSRVADLRIEDWES